MLSFLLAQPTFMKYDDFLREILKKFKSKDFEMLDEFLKIAHSSFIAVFEKR